MTPETARLLKHWRHQLSGRPAVLLPDRGRRNGDLADRGRAQDRERAATSSGSTSKAPTTQANPELLRLALKLATGAGKTTVMAMLIAWQTVNAVRHPSSKHFTRGFLVVTPGITIKDRLRVLQPNDPDSYYRNRELVPADMLGDIDAPRSSSPTITPSSSASGWSVAKGGRALLRGRRGEELETLETEGQMLQRVCPN